MHVEVINGLLGAGKTTYLQNLLENRSGNEKIAVLVNEFGEIGIDGDLLDGQGADVVELPNGCICCTLSADLKRQINYIAVTYHPDSLFIEPTGVATIKNIMSVLQSLSLEKYIEDIKINVIIDASTFQEMLSQNRGFVETQIQRAHTMIINKCDMVNYSDIEKILIFIRSVNSSGEVLLSVFGRVYEKVKGLQDIKPQYRDKFPLKHIHEQTLIKYEQFSRTSQGIFDTEKLRDFFLYIKDSKFGSVDRAKGLFQITGGKWMRFDLASHEINEIRTDRIFSSSKIMVIGTKLQKDALKEGFIKCLAI